MTLGGEKARSRLEFCRRRLEPSGEWCGADAEFIVWGKLYPAEALGPRCYDCAAEQVGHRALTDESHAIFHLRRVVPAAYAERLKGALRDAITAAEDLAPYTQGFSENEIVQEAKSRLTRTRDFLASLEASDA